MKAKAYPLSPDAVTSAQEESLPPEVFYTFNRLIVENWNGLRAKIAQLEAQTYIAAALNITTSEVFERKLLNIESVYRKAGWIVEYDKPGYNEDYAATYTFSKRMR